MALFNNIFDSLKGLPDIDVFSSGSDYYNLLKYVNEPQFFEERHLYVGPKDKTLSGTKEFLDLFLIKILNIVPIENQSSVVGFDRDTNGINLAWIDYVEKIGEETTWERNGEVIKREYSFSEQNLKERFPLEESGNLLTLGHKRVRDMERLLQIHILPSSELAKDFSLREDISHRLYLPERQSSSVFDEPNAPIPINCYK